MSTAAPAFVESNSAGAAASGRRSASEPGIGASASARDAGASSLRAGSAGGPTQRARLMPGTAASASRHRACQVRSGPSVAMPTRRIGLPDSRLSPASGCREDDEDMVDQREDCGGCAAHSSATDRRPCLRRATRDVHARRLVMSAEEKRGYRARGRFPRIPRGSTRSAKARWTASRTPRCPGEG